MRNGTAKLLTLFRPATGQVRVTGVKGVPRTPNAVLPPWLKEAVTALLAERPEPPSVTGPAANRVGWEQWQVGLRVKVALPAALPSLRMLLIWDSLTGHHTPDLLLWLLAQGVMVLYTPLSGSWLNMAESIQRMLKRRALEGHHPQTVEDLIGWLEATAAGWNVAPTPFVWGGKRAWRRTRARERRHALGGSGACIRRPLRRRQLAHYNGYIHAN